MNSLLHDSAVAYNRLLGVQYSMRLGRKGREHAIDIWFPEDGYHHLAGFQYARAVNQLRNRKEALRNVLNMSVTADVLVDAGCYDIISGRLLAICRIPEFIETNKISYHYIKDGPQHSRIKAQYMLVYEIDRMEACLFLDGENGLFIPVSVFMGDSKQYMAGSEWMKTLRVMRMDGDVSTTIYCAPSYKPST